MKNLISGIVAFALLVGLGYMFAQAWIIEDDARMAKLRQHLYDVAYSRVEGPGAAAPAPQPWDMAIPKVRHFQDSARGGWKP